MRLEEELKEHQEHPKYKDLGGWLLLPALMVLFAPFRAVLVLLDIATLMSSETWPVLTTPGAEAYHPLWAPLCVFELIGNIGLFVASIVLAVCFGMKKRFVPGFFIGWLLANLAFVLADALLVSQIPAARGTDYIKAVGGAIVVCGIWIPYFLVSKRVKATFVK